MQIVLTVAGSDSGAGAGIQADLKSISANGGYGLSVLTSVTAQNTKAITAAMPLPVELIDAQFAAIYDDFQPAAVKSGMVADIDRINAVGAALDRYITPNYVLDPVMVATSGDPLLEENAVVAVLTVLVPHAHLVTPNIREAEIMAEQTIETLGDARQAGRRILERGCGAVLIKGGHLDAMPATDLLISRESERQYEGEFIDTTSTHGTGCTYSAAIATHLAHGSPLPEAIARAKRYITEAIRAGLPLGGGSGPTDHFYFLDRAARRAVSP